MATDFDPYRILGVDRRASADDVRAAYERLGAEVPAGSQQRREVEAAYAVLGSEEKRREYDTRLSLREMRGMPAASAEALTMASAPAADETVRWTPRDIGLALILPLLLIALNVGAGFLADIDTETNEEVALESGLRYIDFESGAGEEAKTGDMVAVNFTGWFDATGDVFDSSVDKTEPLRVTIGSGQVIQGWEQGLPGMNEGDKRRLIIPPELAYGEAGLGDAIPPNATLLFDVELVAILAPGAVQAPPSPTPPLPSQEPDVPDESPPDVRGGLSEADHIVNFGFGFVLEVALLGLAFNFAIRRYGGSWRSLGLHWPRDLQWWFPLAIAGGAFATILAWAQLLNALGIAPDSNIPENVYDFAIPVIMLGLLSVIAAPFAEEVFFRGFLYQGVAKRWGMWAGIGFSAFIFGLAHAGAPDSWLLLPAIAAIGGIFAWGFAKSGSIYPSLFAHIVFNSVSFLVGFTE